MRSFTLELNFPSLEQETLAVLVSCLPFSQAPLSQADWLGTVWQAHYSATAASHLWIAQAMAGSEWVTLEASFAPLAATTQLHLVLRYDGTRTYEQQFVEFVELFQSMWASLASQPKLQELNTKNAHTHPLTWQAFEHMQALDELERIKALDQRWAKFEQGQLPPLKHTMVTTLPWFDQRYDLVYAGGGLGLLHAVLMAERGYRVLVFDRYEVGCAHREWNISHEELQRLVDLDFISWEELEASIIMTRYSDGVVRFYADGSTVEPSELHLPNVLNIALDAGALLRYAREQFLAAGGTIAEGWQFDHLFASHKPEEGVVVQVDTPEGRQHIAAQLMIDAMGATSPLTLATQPFEGICPTVGTVVTGLADHDPDLGDILISVADVQDGKQLIWEGFPGRDAELTVYVFYYDQVGARAQHIHSLLDLFEVYFQYFETYKTPGPDFEHIRPLYGFIPGRHALKRPVPLAGVLPIGDASAQQSPLTFCGFGSFIRNLQRTTDGLHQALQQQFLQPHQLREISAYQVNVSMNWVFSRFMAPWKSEHDVNQLQNVFAKVLNQLGLDIAQRFFQDQMTWSDYRRVILGTLDVYPPIIRTAWEVLGWRDIRHWITDWLRFSRAAFLARLFGSSAPRFVRIADRLYPALGFKIRATLAEWRAMGWIS